MTARAVAAALLAVVLGALPAVLGACGFFDGDESESRLTGPTRTPLPEPVIAELVVCDSTVDCGEQPGRTAWEMVQACLRITAARTGLRVSLVATREDRPPASPFSPQVVARSEPVPASDTFACHNVMAAGPRLTAGEYWLWVLDGTRSLGGRRFVLTP